MSDTPLCDALARDALDSNDMSAWHSLAYRLEKELARLRVVRPEVEATKDAERYRWLKGRVAFNAGLFIGQQTVNGVSRLTGTHADAAVDTSIALYQGITK